MPSPPPNPKNTCVSTVCSEFQHCIGCGRGTSKVVLKGLHCFMGATMNYRKLRMLHHFAKKVRLILIYNLALFAMAVCRRKSSL